MKQLKVISSPKNACVLHDLYGRRTATCALYDHNCSQVASDEDGELYCEKYLIIFVEVDDEK